MKSKSLIDSDCIVYIAEKGRIEYNVLRSKQSFLLSFKTESHGENCDQKTFF